MAAGPGDIALGFANPDLSGVYHTSKTEIGRSWLLLDFFATDCEPCLRELPELSLLAAEWAPRGLTVLVFATDPQGESVVGRFFETRAPLPYTVLIDRYRVTAERYGVRVIPSLFLVDPSGTIRYAAAGYAEETLREVRRLLEAELFSGGQAAGDGPDRNDPGTRPLDPLPTVTDGPGGGAE